VCTLSTTVQCVCLQKSNFPLKCKSAFSTTVWKSLESKRSKHQLMRNFRSSIVHTSSYISIFVIIIRPKLAGCVPTPIKSKDKVATIHLPGYYMLNKLRWAAPLVEREYFCCIAAAICSCRIENIVAQCVNIQAALAAML
jgi:hypothetical protein